MDGIYNHYIIDMASNNNFVQFSTMQGDGNNVRGFEVELIENGKQYVINPNTTIVSIAGTKADTKQILNECVITEDGYILIDVTSQMSAVKGRGDYSIVLMDKEKNSQLKSFPFYILTTSAPFDINHIISSDEFQLLTKRVTEVETIVDTGNVVINRMNELENTVSTNENERVLNENNRISSELDRVNAENIRLDSENKRITSENERISNENTRKSEEIIRVNSENTRINNENTRIANETTRESEFDSFMVIANAEVENLRQKNDTATASAELAEQYKNSAKSSADIATEKEANASISASTATIKASEAINYATKAESFTQGGTGTRENEDVQNTQYYYEQVKQISEGLNGALLPMGTITFSQLSSQTKHTGYMFNISDEFTTSSDFKEGAGYVYPAGTNVYYTADGKWDCLAGTMVTGVKGNAEDSYRKGNINITMANLGYENVENKSSATIRDEITKNNISNALGYTPIYEVVSSTEPVSDFWLQEYT